MPVTIGKKQEGDFHHPLELLSACHRRIEHFLGILIAVTRQAGGGNLTADHRSALEASLRYFREAAPRHSQDEEESLFPRLRKCSQREVRERMATLDRLNSEHQDMQLAHDHVEQLVRQWLEHDHLDNDKLQQLDATLKRLEETYKEHIAVEDHDIFPMAARTMQTDELETVGREMAFRRGIHPD